MKLIKFTGFTEQNKHMITRVGEYLGWGDMFSIPRQHQYESAIDTEVCFNTGYLEGYDALGLISEAIEAGLVVEFFMIKKTKNNP